MRALFIKLYEYNQLREPVLRPHVGTSVGAHRQAGPGCGGTEQTWRAGEESEGSKLEILMLCARGCDRQPPRRGNGTQSLS